MEALVALLSVGGIIAISLFIWILSLRTIVPTDMVHIVQTAHKTTSYGKDKENGNCYFAWPIWLPIVGCTVRTLPVSNFDLDINNYEAYDKDRLPFMVDIKAFFRIKDTNEAACRVANIEELDNHLRGIVQGAARTILAKSKLEDIMEERATYGKQFTEEVQTQLTQWGVEAVKSIELMDIRDSGNSVVIANIMKKKSSAIEKESRIEVAKNLQAAQEQEIESTKTVNIKNVEAKQVIGEREAEQKRKVGIVTEKANQDVQAEAKKTKEAEMNVLEVEIKRKAEIDKEAIIVRAEAEKQETEVKADANLTKDKKQAEGIKALKDAEANGISATGKAKAESEKALQLASVAAQTELQKSVSNDSAYQQYLITIKKIEVDGEVRKEQAKALAASDTKIIVNSGDVAGGVEKLTDIFNAKGGASFGAALENLANTETGKNFITKFLTPNKDKKKA